MTHHADGADGTDGRLFRLEFSRHSRIGRLCASASRPLERMLALDRLNEIYAKAADPARATPSGATPGDAAAGRLCGRYDFLLRTLDELGVRYHVPRADLERVPRTGPLVVVSNHPFGAIDGMVLAAALGSVRRDVKVIANYLLGRIPDLRDLFIFVNPFGSTAAAAANVGPLRQCLRWVKGGAALASFPAGEVAHLRLRDRQVTDPPWNPSVARIVRATGASVLPVYFDGRNGPLFQVLGLLHPRLRTALLPRELFRRQDSSVELRIGSVIPAARLESFGDDADGLTDHLRRRTFLLRHRPAHPPATPTGVPFAAARSGAGSVPVPEPIVAPVDPPLLLADVRALPAEATLLTHDQYTVYHARAPHLRNVLREIGRLREETFRAVGEGTGRALDLDTFDFDYEHLFVWNHDAGEVVGAYRLGQTDMLLPAKGRGGLYTNTLFDYRPGVLEAELGPALEMGRSFVRAEYQKSYAPLLLLWKGIGHYVVRHPRYRRLFGAVSISNSYQPVSRQLIVQFLARHYALAGSDPLATARRAFRTRPIRGWDDRAGAAANSDLPDDPDDLSSLVADLEPDRKGLPVLVRQYLKLGAKFLAFGVDPDFGNSLDGLIVVDLLRTEARVLERYMTRDGYRSFVARHAGRDEPAFVAPVRQTGARR